MSRSLVLHNYWRSSASWRVRIALHHKGLPFEYAPVHLVKDGGEQYRDAFRALNPLAQVPALEIREGDTTRVLTQSLAIIEWLEERYPERPLLHGDAETRATIRQYAELINAGIQPLQNLVVLGYVGDTLQGDKKAWAQHWIGRGLDALEVHAKHSAGTFLVGDAVSLADVCLVPQLNAARRQSLEVGRWPTLLKVEAACEALEAFQKAHADAQPDAQR